MNVPVVAKVGGSLFDLADLDDRLRHWYRGLGDRPVLLLPGGGRAADEVRRLDRTHHLGDSTAHWLALRALSVNAHFLAKILGIPVIASIEAGRGGLTVLDPFAFCQADEVREGRVEHSWRITSDSVAARVAAVAGGLLVLLKSIERPADSSWDESSRAGLVDEAFPELVSKWGLRVTWVNLRAMPLSPRR